MNILYFRKLIKIEKLRNDLFVITIFYQHCTSKEQMNIILFQCSFYV
jgi:hypothetical protein